MPRFAEVTHREWIAAPVSRVRAQFADLEHHIKAGAHPKLRFEILQRSANRARYVQQVKLLGLSQRDVFVREFEPDGTMIDTSIEGFNKGGSIVVRFDPQTRAERAGTDVEITIRLPLPPLIGPLLRPLLQWQVRREVCAAAAEDKRDIEVGQYGIHNAGAVSSAHA